MLSLVLLSDAVTSWPSLSLPGHIKDAFLYLLVGLVVSPVLSVVQYRIADRLCPDVDFSAHLKQDNGSVGRVVAAIFASSILGPFILVGLICG